MSINNFGKCIKCGYEGTVEINEKAETVCNLCLLSNVNEEEVNFCSTCETEISKETNEKYNGFCTECYTEIYECIELDKLDSQD